MVRTQRASATCRCAIRMRLVFAAFRKMTERGDCLPTGLRRRASSCRRWSRSSARRSPPSTAARSADDDNLARRVRAGSASSHRHPEVRWDVLHLKERLSEPPRPRRKLQRRDLAARGRRQELAKPVGGLENRHGCSEEKVEVITWKGRLLRSGSIR